MKIEPYSRFNKENLVLRDELAIDRTLLANERTLLAYLRSAIALLIAGATIIQFSPQDWFWWIGIACIPVGIITGLVGAVRYWRMNRSITNFRNRETTAARLGIKDDHEDN